MRTYLLASLLLACAFPALAQTNPEPLHTERTRFLRWAYQDLGALGSEIVTPKFAAYAGGAAAFTLGTAWLDDDGVRQAQSLYGQNDTYKEVLLFLDDAGGPPMTQITLGLAAGSLLIPNTKFQDAAMTSLQTLIYAGLTGYALKGIIGRARPEDGPRDPETNVLLDLADPYAFFETTGKNPFTDGNSSYPSGHAISSFGIITVWASYYPHPLTYALYVIPAGAVLNRMSVDKHWPTDIVVGAAIGVGTARFLVNRHKAIQRGDVASNGDPSGWDFDMVPTSARLTYTF